MTGRCEQTPRGETDPSRVLHYKLGQHGIDFYVSVPCKLLDGLIRTLDCDSNIIHTPVTREEEGLGILAGATLTGRRGAMVMQNSGLGNCVNAVKSLTQYFQLPMIFVISHRGTEGEKIEAQKPMGLSTVPVLTALGVPHYEVKATRHLSVLDEAIPRAFNEGIPIALLFPFSFWR